jgi:hypothetical protein
LPLLHPFHLHVAQGKYLIVGQEFGFNSDLIDCSRNSAPSQKHKWAVWGIFNYGVLEYTRGWSVAPHRSSQTRLSLR